MASRWIDIWARLCLKSEDKEADVLSSLMFDFQSNDYSVLKKCSWELEKAPKELKGTATL
jgi:IS4 transposase